MLGTDREKYMMKVWLSCKTKDQRRNTEKWINRVAERFPSREHQYVTDFIDQMFYVEECPNEPPSKEYFDKKLERSVMDLRHRVMKLEEKTK